MAESTKETHALVMRQVKNHSHITQRYFSKDENALGLAGSTTSPIYYSVMCKKLQGKQ